MSHVIKVELDISTQNARSDKQEQIKAWLQFWKDIQKEHWLANAQFEFHISI